MQQACTSIARWSKPALKAGGDPGDKEKFMAALRAVSLDRHAARADQVRSFRQCGRDTFYVRRCGTEGAKYGLKLWNKIIKTYENVSQFWTWPEEEFLAHPVYSRDYPPLKKC